MKKFIAVLCVITLLSTCFVGCGDKNQKDNTDTPEYLDAKKLYYYDELLEMLESNQETEDLGIINYYSERAIPVNRYEGSIEPEVLHIAGKAINYPYYSLGYPFAQISMKMNANPFSNFKLLVDKEWFVPYEHDYAWLEEEITDGVVFNFDSGLLGDAGKYLEYNIPKFSTKKVFEYSEDGCSDFVKTVAALERTNLNSHPFASLPKDDYLEINYSQKDDCYFTYLIYCDRSDAYITAIYFRSSDKKHITDITTQLMSISFPAGNVAAGSSLTHGGYYSEKTLGKLSFFMALEKTLTGDCLFSEDKILCYYEDNSEDDTFVIPYEYEGKNYTAKISEKYYVTAEEYYHPVDKGLLDHINIYTYSLSLK